MNFCWIFIRFSTFSQFIVYWIIVYLKGENLPKFFYIALIKLKLEEWKIGFCINVHDADNFIFFCAEIRNQNDLRFVWLETGAGVRCWKHWENVLCTFIYRFFSEKLIREAPLIHFIKSNLFVTDIINKWYLLNL